MANLGVWLEEVQGVEGNSIYIADKNGGRRISGPKPWGGGTVIKKWPLKDCDVDDIVKMLRNARRKSKKVSARKGREE